MKSYNIKNTRTIKRRNFFYYIGASLIGIFSISKIPLNIFSNRIKREISGYVKISENPYAVKRKNGGRRNSG